MNQINMALGLLLLLGACVIASMVLLAHSIGARRSFNRDTLPSLSEFTEAPGEALGVEQGSAPKEDVVASGAFDMGAAGGRPGDDVGLPSDGQVDRGGKYSRRL